MKKFDYSFLKNSFLPASLLNIISGISELRALQNVREKDFKNIFTKLEGIARVQSVKSSNEIEGIISSDKRIEEIVNRSSAPLNHNEEEIAGYRDALNLIHENYQDIQLKESDILQLHTILLSYTNNYERGQYKKSDNVILELDKQGNRKVRFTPTPAIETKQTMEQLVFAYMSAKNDAGINQLLLIPCFILDFLCIHPFSDGNGRMSRLLSLLLLYKNGFTVGKFISFEEQINSHKNDYYEALKESSFNWDKGDNTYIPFIEKFIITLLMCYKELDSRISIINTKHVTKKSRIEATVMNSLIPLSKKEINHILPDISITTIENILSEMLKSGKIKKIGKFKAAKYIKG